MSPEEFVASVQSALEPHRNPENAAPMARYMKERFVFLGLKRPELQPLVRPVLAAAKPVADTIRKAHKALLSGLSVREALKRRETEPIR